MSGGRCLEPGPSARQCSYCITVPHLSLNLSWRVSGDHSLRGIDPGIKSPGLSQLIVRALLDDSPTVEHDHLTRDPPCCETVRAQQNGYAAPRAARLVPNAVERLDDGGSSVPTSSAKNGSQKLERGDSGHGEASARASAIGSLCPPETLMLDSPDLSVQTVGEPVPTSVGQKLHGRPRAPTAQPRPAHQPLAGALERSQIWNRRKDKNCCAG